MKQAMRSQLMIENLGEELRVLYVAMTRAREKLYLTGAKDHLFDYLEKKIHETDKTARELSYSQLTMAGSFLDWITAAACKHKKTGPLKRSCFFVLRTRRSPGPG